MTHFLICSYYFPPIGGAGTQRPAHFARRFRDLGHECTVLTGTGVPRARWAPGDPSLLETIPESVRVLRVPGPEPEQAQSMRARAERWLPVRSDWSRWWTAGAVEEGSRARGIDVIYTIMSPFESAEVSLALSKRLGVPWIADLGDPWALDEMAVFATGFHRRAELARMKRLLRSAAGIVMSTPDAAAELVRVFPDLAQKPVVAIPNGYDAHDFEAPAPERAPDRFRIVHTGYLHTELGLRQQRTRRLRSLVGGQIKNVEILTRSHIHLLRALEQLIERRPELASKIELTLAGVLSGTDKNAAAGFPFVRMPGYLSHAESVSLMRSADLLFLPMQKLPPGRRSTTVPGKTYEYIASRRPILAAVPSGDARDILAAAGTARLCPPGDVESMERLIEEELERTSDPTPENDIAARFEYGHLAVRAAAFTEDVLSRSTSRSSVREEPDSTSIVPPADRSRRPRMTRVLLVAYHFPPIGGAGAQRSLKLVRYLDRTKYELIVITGPGSTSGRWTPTDETLEAEIPERTQVIRVPGPEPDLPSGWGRRANRWLGLRSDWSHWWIDGLRTAAMETQADVIIASASPYETIEATAQLSERLGAPWIAGLRDPWALDEMMIYPTGVHRRLEIARMRRLLLSSSAIVVTTNEAALQFRAALPEAKVPIVSVPNGYDEEDFASAPPPRDGGKFRIVHTGYLHTELGLQQRRVAPLRRLLGGGTEGVDLLTRSHVYLFKAIERLLERDPSLVTRLEVHLAGVLSPTDREIVTSSNVAVLHGYLSHADSIALMRSADMLFLPMQNLPPGRRSSTIPGKTFEYLASGQPILGAVPPGDARDILERSGSYRVRAGRRRLDRRVGRTCCRTQRAGSASARPGLESRSYIRTSRARPELCSGDREGRRQQLGGTHCFEPIGGEHSVQLCPTTRLGAIRNVELSIDVRQMELHRLLGDPEHLGKLRVRVPFRDQPEDLQLTTRELLDTV